ncbi:MAG: acyl-ACP--UDP-N-acetylglucosamine O-acyltransferase [Alphaproteobacteria bacterium]|nr:acyl-[acyl-carrier-protein]--UDP-N-acetylglucosamine O-acyltransferase [Rhodobiaceae bacterium]MBO6542034.1 acyl-ACP--UDP-N-acetylglucosamine O-acyltransferase [Alphaproteobacteria bacterium]MBO6628203.1 acyl-ACP--UDP-N-acetylglucosamine O-acyltransferase [Alphaproteobacteria bacterium]MDF1625109.1 acyl-ACP--UDP-N-acetylglucosamine O-acyltransferase [Parvibaculaceae bacterium]|tara:strand:+ start:937 stop:1737 length:801 start_codon:yes stop_codon:yes gene_type:complete
MTDIHPTALVDPKAELATDVVVGPYSIVGPRVTLGEGVKIHSHVVVDGKTSIGAKTEIYPFASIGQPPQDLKYRGEESQLIVGENNTIREHVTMNSGTEGGGLITKVGNNCAFLAASHVGHDTIVGDYVVMSNNVMLAGHCHIGNHVIIGGGAGIHQFSRVGDHAFIGGMSGVENDVIPFGIVLGNRARLAGLNIIGLKRRGFDRERIQALRGAYRVLFADDGTLHDRVDAVASQFVDQTDVMQIVNFLRADKSRSICTPRDAHEA